MIAREKTVLSLQSRRWCMRQSGVGANQKR
nr:MAG TPA: hypothetical protein [Caudoviricetes sp.]